MKDNALISYLGANSYPAVLEKISNKLMTSEASTITGNDLLGKAFKNLNESITPILQLKEFTTNAELLAPNDAKLSTIVNFIKKEVTGADLNFLVNLCKEEHYANLARNGNPDPQQTLKAIEADFNEPASVIEAGIKKGIFDSLQSNLMMNLKSDLIDDKSKNPVNKKTELKIDNLNESTIFDNNIAIYSPIAVKMENTAKGNIVFLTESCVLEINGETKDLCQVTDLGTVEIPMAHKRLMGAISNLNYDPQQAAFSLTQDWDFEMELQKDGKVTVSKPGIDKAIIVAKEDVSNMLLESINVYANRIPNFNRIPYNLDADNFVLLLENHNKLIALDEYKTIKNLTTEHYSIVNLNESRPYVVATSEGTSQLFESFDVMTQKLSALIGTQNIDKLFDVQLSKESNIVAEIQNKLGNLKNEQSQINELLRKNSQLKSIAEVDSPAFDKLNEQSNELNQKLEANLTNLNESQDKLKNLYPVE